MGFLALATEDELSEAVGLRLISVADPGIDVTQRLRRGGFGYLRTRLPNFIVMSRYVPVVVIADQDQVECPAAIVRKWLGEKTCPENLVLRFAEREVEAWLLADHDGIRTFLGPRIRRLPEQPDTLVDPKQTLLRLARSAPADLRRDLCADVGAIARQGLGYNNRMSVFARDVWRPDRAVQRSPSLARACRRIGELAARLRRPGASG